MATVQDIISTALAEIGYLEKQTNKNLDSKTANAGYKNFNKYARDMDAIPDFYNGLKNGFDWCAIFIAWCFVQVFGPDKAMQLLRLPKKSAGASCTYIAGRFKQADKLYRTPKVGDLVLFTQNGGSTFYHIGLVTNVDGNYFYTVEGNTSGKSGVVANGGGVFQKRYLLNSNTMRFARPDYDTEPETAPVPEKTGVNVEMWTSKDEKGRILDIALKVDHGSIWYQVHTLGGKWLPKVTGFDKNDFINGYAGNHTPIDAIRVYYETPAGEDYKQARYAVKTAKRATWLPDQVDNYTHDGMDGYAGNLGEAITDFRFRVDDE